MALSLLGGKVVRAGSVSEAEAVTTAEWWYATEINAAHTPLPAAERRERLAAKSRHAVSYILGRDNWQPTRKATEAVDAYVVAFQPSGFVVVSGEDTLPPVMVFNATGSFNLSGSPKTNYLAYYLERCLARRVEQERSLAIANPPNTNWASVRAWVKSGISPTSRDGGTPGQPATPNPHDSGIYVLLPTALWNQGNYYNNLCVTNNGGIDVPTGCVATALAIQFRYYEWPWWGNGANAYTDTLTNEYGQSFTFTQSVDFADQYYDWDNMPTNNITSPNWDVAHLMYDCGVAVDMGYGLAGSGAWPDNTDPSPAINDYFSYRGTIVDNSSTPSEHVAAMSYCIQCGVPVVVGTEDHCFVACGYRTTVSPYFYFNMGWGGGNDGWYNVTDIKPDSDNPLNGSLPYSTPDNYAYVDAGVASNGNGDLQTPYQTFAEGESGVARGGVLWLKTGQYQGAGSGSLTLSEPMTIKSYLGAATVGN
jgi:hypothetical protein